MSNFDLERCMKEDGGKCVTSDGCAARVICADRDDPSFPIVALVTHAGGEDVETFSIVDSGLENLPRKLKGWINIYPGLRAVYDHKTRKDADSRSSSDRIACIDLSQFEEGHGL